MANARTKTAAIRNHLIKYGKITSMEAFERYKCTRLSARIYDLRRQGMAIDKVTQSTVDDFGTTIYYAEYFYTAPTED